MATIYIVKDYGEIKSYFTDKHKAQDYATRHNYTLECHTTDDDLEEIGDAFCFVIELTIIKKYDQEVTVYMNTSNIFSYNSKTNFINTNSALNYTYNSKQEELIIKKTVSCKKDITFGERMAIGNDFRHKAETALKFGASIMDILITLKENNASEW